MPTKLEGYFDDLFENNNDPFSGFIGAYNMGLFGLSVSGNAPLEQGLLASGRLMRRKPRWTDVGPDNPAARNYVKYIDTPRLWGFGDKHKWGLSQSVYRAAKYAAAVLGVSLSWDMSEEDRSRVSQYVKQHSFLTWDGEMGKPWSEIATVHNIQSEMNRVGAWSELVGRWRAVIAQSCYLVDVTSLSPPVTDSEAQVGICQGIAACIENWIRTARDDRGPAPPPLMIRVLFGMTAAQLYGTGANTYWNEFYKKLESTLRPYSQEINDIGGVKPVVLYGSDMGKMISTFNHSKIVAGDGQYAVVGGHNMCEEVSSNRAPVIHDITCEVTGPGAKSANAFAGSLWMKAAESGRLYIYRFNWSKRSFDDLSKEATKKWAPKNYWNYELGTQTEVPNVLRNQYWYYPMDTLPLTPAVDPPEGSVPATAVLGIGRWGDTKVFNVDGTNGLKVGREIPNNYACHYTCDTLKRMMIRDRKNTIIRMSQQDLVNAGYFGGKQNSEHTICEAIGKRLLDTPTGTAIQVVVSSRFTQNSEGLAYSYGDGPREAAERISDTVVRTAHCSSDKEDLPERLEVLNIKAEVGSAPEYIIRRSDDPSFATVAPLTFCEARGTTRDRGSYVWPDARYKMEKIYTNGRFWDYDKDAKQLGFGPGNHSKVICVSEGEDDSKAVVLIGSDNMYPSPLSEFSFVIEGQEAIEAFRAQYWDPLWRYSARLGFTVWPDGVVS